MTNRPDADDALQNGLVKIFSKIGDFDENLGFFRSWSGKIVVNECIMLLRKRNKSFLFSKELDTDMYLPAYDSNPIEHLNAEEITKVIQKLPDGYRTVFNMYAVEGYTHKEISEKLQITVGTSKSQLSKAKNLLRQKVDFLVKIA